MSRTIPNHQRADSPTHRAQGYRQVLGDDDGWLRGTNSRRRLILVRRDLGSGDGGMTGQLTLDDGTVIPVEVRGPFLREIDTAQAS